MKGVQSKTQMECPAKERLAIFAVQYCSNLYRCSLGSGASSTERIVVDIDLMQLLDSWPEGGHMITELPLHLLLQVIQPTVANALNTDLGLILRPSHLAPMLHVPLSTSIQYPEGATVILTGTVVRLYSKRVVPSRTRLHCPTCRAEHVVESNPFDRGATIKLTCDGGTKSARCKGQELVVFTQEWMDYTECRIQPRMSGPEGRLPQSVTVTLDDELVSKCSAGQLVEVIGTARTRWRQSFAKATPQIEIIVWAHNITPKDEGSVALRREPVSSASHLLDPCVDPMAFARLYDGSPELFRTLLLSSTCPQLSGLVGPRLGVLLSSIGGAEVKDEKTGHRVRGSVHCLLVGDPSTGKSQLLRFAAQIATRSVVTTGFTSSTAGLTAAATKEFGEWALEPGALVLSDGGTCVIDELRTVSVADRTALHEAMEQQTISVAKAGLVTRLRTECTVVAACNPPMKKGSTQSQGLSAELGVGGPLLSRFDFIFLLWDSGNERLDDTIASHILQTTSADFVPSLSTEQLARYLAFVRQRYARTGGPLLDNPAADLISRYYHHKRTRPGGHSLCQDIPITIRFLESLVRISQAHAKLLLKSQCDITDAAMAIFVIERTAHTTQTSLFTDGNVSIRTGSSELDACFLGTDASSLAMQKRIISRIIELFSQVEPDTDGSEKVSQHTSSMGMPSPVASKRMREEDSLPSSRVALRTAFDDAVGVSPSLWSASAYVGEQSPARRLTGFSTE